MQEAPDALASFAEKWFAAEPELGLAIRFLVPSERASRTAFACIQREIEHAAFGIRDNDVAVTKLTWWYEELLRARAGEARHPLTEVLVSERDVAVVPAAAWQDWIVAAVGQREREPAATLDAMLAIANSVHVAAAAIENRLFGAIDPQASAQATGLAHALRALAAIGSVLDSGHLPLPLDRLARHQLARDSLRNDTEPRRQAIREQLQDLAERLDELARAAPRLGLIRYAGMVADRSRAHAAARAQDPSTALAFRLQRVPMTVPWRIWRAARSLQRSPVPQRGFPGNADA